MSYIELWLFWTRMVAVLSNHQANMTIILNHHSSPVLTILNASENDRKGTTPDHGPPQGTAPLPSGLSSMMPRSHQWHIHGMIRMGRYLVGASRPIQWNMMAKPVVIPKMVCLKDQTIETTNQIDLLIDCESKWTLKNATTNAQRYKCKCRTSKRLNWLLIVSLIKQLNRDKPCPLSAWLTCGEPRCRLPVQGPLSTCRWRGMSGTSRSNMRTLTCDHMYLCKWM